MVINIRRSEAIQSFFSSPYIILFSKDLLRTLNSLNQGIKRIEHHLDRYINIITSSWKDSYDAYKFIYKDLVDKNVTANDIDCKIQKWEKDDSKEIAEKAQYLKLVHTLNKDLHVDGIGGEESDYTIGKDIYGESRKLYNAHESWVLAIKFLKREKEEKYLRFSEGNWRGVISDSLLFFLLLLSYLFSIL